MIADAIEAIARELDHERLLILSRAVRRQERALDEIAADALEDERLPTPQTRTGNVIPLRRKQ